MKKLPLLIVLFLLQSLAFGQIHWTYDLKSAQALSLSQNKLIVMDFWAYWCGPCLAMDRDLWSREEVIALFEHFVPLRVDVDMHPHLARKYQLNAIPKVVVVDVAGNVIWEQVGYQEADVYLGMLKNLPTNAETLNQYLLPVLQENDQINDHLNLAYIYQKWGKEIEYASLQAGFLNLSNTYFKKVAKKSNDALVSETAELNLLLNEAYTGNSKRVLKKIEKLDPLTGEASHELKKFIQAYCFQCDGQTQAAKSLKQEIKNEKYLAELENLP